MKKTLAIDMGATSIRAIVGYINDNTLITEEIMRFSHEKIHKNGRTRWKIHHILDNIKSLIIKYGNEIDSIAIDSWGVDFGAIDKSENLIVEPICYRDEKNIIGYNYAKSILSPEDIFLKTGNQIMDINTLYQLLTLKELDKKIYEKIYKILMMPDLINYYLCGEICAEDTILSTSQLIDLSTNTLSDKIFGAYNIDKNILGKNISPAQIIGNTHNSKIKELKKYDIKIIATASHDTASAIFITKAFVDDDAMFLSCGTWSLLGVVTKKPVITKEAFEGDLTNETGYDGSNALFKNITGLYVVEKLKKELEKKYNKKINYDEITKNCEKLKNIKDYFDLDKNIFKQENFDVIKEINLAINKKYDDDFVYFKIIYNSLVKKYTETINTIKNITNRNYRKIHIIGGGAKSTLLCEMIASETGLTVIAGPTEATSYGNIIIQQLALKEISSVKDGINIIENHSNYKYYEK